MIGLLPTSRTTLLVFVVGVVMIFAAGAGVGANEAATGGQPIAENESVPPLGDTIRDDFRDEFSDAPGPVTVMLAQFGHNMGTLGDYGAAIGYASVERVGMRGTQIWLYGLVIGTFAGCCFRTYRVVGR